MCNYSRRKALLIISVGLSIALFLFLLLLTLDRELTLSATPSPPPTIILQQELWIETKEAVTSTLPLSTITPQQEYGAEDGDNLFPTDTPKLPPPFDPSSLEPGQPLPGEDYPPK